MEQKRYSRQRELIYQCLQEMKVHPTAEMIYQTLKPDHPKLSLGTVYRNLNQLADWGLIIRMPFHVERYDADLSPHAHFCCEGCGRVFDLPMPEGEDMTPFCAEHGFHLRREARLFYGRCLACGECYYNGTEGIEDRGQPVDRLCGGIPGPQ